MPRRGMQFLFCFLAGVETMQCSSREVCGIHGSAFTLVVLRDQGNEIMEVLNAFAGPEVHAKAGSIHARTGKQSGVGQRLLGGGGGELAVHSRIGPALRLLRRSGSDRSP